MEDALRIANISLSGREIYVNDEGATLHDEVEDGDVIVLSKKIEAGK